MKGYNISLLSDQERRNIELSRKAALMIYNMKKGEITRAKINSELNILDVSEQENFKYFLNKYRLMK